MIEKAKKKVISRYVCALVLCKKEREGVTQSVEILSCFFVHTHTHITPLLNLGEESKTKLFQYVCEGERARRMLEN